MEDQKEKRLVVIKNNKIKMERMKRMLGVKMGEKGVRKIVQVDIKKEEKIREES